MRFDKSKKRKAGDKKKWNLVPVGEEFLKDEEFANLTSIEVLNDYSVMRGGQTEKITSTARQKRSFIEDEDSDKNVTKKLKKSRNDGKKAIKSDVIATSAWEVVNMDNNDDEENDNENLAFTNQLKESPKKKLKSENLKKKSKNVMNKVEKNNQEAQFLSLKEWAGFGLSTPTMEALQEMRFFEPTPIQKLTLPSSVLGKKDIVGAAETGSGKTLAFVIPIVEGILADRKKLANNSELKALILTPTRELALQIKSHTDAICRTSKIQSIVLVGGLASQKQERLLKKHPDIVIATPGRLWELIQSHQPYLTSLNKLKFLAVDETDRMLEPGHFSELQNILEMINHPSQPSRSRQTFVFSATLSFTHDPPERMKTSMKKKKVAKISSKDKLNRIMSMIGVKDNPKIVDITNAKGTCESLEEMEIQCLMNQKDYYLYYFIQNYPGRTIVFCNSINCVRRLHNLFNFLHCGVFPLHSEMHQRQRLKNLERFSSNEKSVLVSTDVAARGLDIKDIEHVVHYQIPRTAESYIHRSGRTARAFKGGISVAMVEPNETLLFKKINKALNREDTLPSLHVDGRGYKNIKLVVDLAIQVEKLEHSFRKKTADLNWKEQAKKKLELLSSDDEESDSEQRNSPKNHLQSLKKKLESYKKQLNKMLA